MRYGYSENRSKGGVIVHLNRAAECSDVLLHRIIRPISPISHIADQQVLFGHAVPDNQFPHTANTYSVSVLELTTPNR